MRDLALAVAAPAGVFACSNPAAHSLSVQTLSRPEAILSCPMMSALARAPAAALYIAVRMTLSRSPSTDRRRETRGLHPVHSLQRRLKLAQMWQLTRAATAALGR